jgi:lipoate-protein ligase A
MPGTIKYLDLTLPSPEANLALEEALLDACEAGGEELLRFWESPRPFVVVGFGRQVREDVNVEACQTDQVPILRRCSGGGTVLQGPGCLNYALVLRAERAAELATVSGANRFIMSQMAAALAALSHLDVRVEGHTDLAVAGVKFSGNAQRRKRQALLFHGALLLEFDLPLIERFLHLPRLQPDYRRQRTHQDFLRNLPLAVTATKAALAQAWEARTPAGEIPATAVATLIETKYARDDWNWRT